MFSMVTVASSTRMPTASARPPRVMMLSVWPVAQSADQRRQHRQRDRGGDDHGGAPASQEQQDHQAGQGRGDDAFAHHAGDRRLHEHRLIVEQVDLEGIGQLLLQQRQQVLDALHDVEGRGRAVLQHGDQHGAAAVDMHDVGLRRIAVAHMADVAHEDGGAVRPS